MVVNVVYERDARSLRSGAIRRGISSLRGEGLRDYVAEEEKRIMEEQMGLYERVFGSDLLFGKRMGEMKGLNVWYVSKG